MADANDQADEADDEDEGSDHLCDEGCELEEHEITADEDLPAATGGVEE